MCGVSESGSSISSPTLFFFFFLSPAYDMKRETRKKKGGMPKNSAFFFKGLLSLLFLFLFHSLPLPFFLIEHSFFIESRIRRLSLPMVDDFLVFQKISLPFSFLWVGPAFVFGLFFSPSLFFSPFSRNDASGAGGGIGGGGVFFGSFDCAFLSALTSPSFSMTN